jgi:Tol biopolymer transport system component
LILFVASGIGVLAVVIAMVTGGPASPGGDSDRLRNAAATAAPRPALTSNDEPNHTNQEIFVINADGSNLKNLTQTSDANEPAFAWSPDGKQIAFLSDRDGGLRAWVMNADGSDPSRFTDTLTYRISWSPDGSKFGFDGISFAFVNSDGKHIAFVGHCFPATPEKQTTRGVPSHIFVVPVKEILTDPKMLWRNIEAFRVGGLPTGWDVIDFAWSPDNTRIAFSTTRGHIAVVAVDGGRLETLTEWNDGFFSFTPTWSPDGNKILFGSVDIDTGTGETLGHGSDIKVINADGSNELKLAKGVDPKWSPDNRKFAFEREGMIYVKVINGGIETALAEGADPAWSPHGKMIAFVSSVIAQPTDQYTGQPTTRDSTESSQNQVFSSPPSP